MEEVFRQVITEDVRANGRTVLLSSHILAEVEALCHRVSIIRLGKVVESGTLTELRHLRRTTVEADLAAPPNGLASLPGVHDLVVDGTRIRCQVDTDQLDALMTQLATTGLVSLVAQPPTLEELFLRHYRGGTVAAA
jgi:ABC-2 type transport system ATP-binding protein